MTSLSNGLPLGWDQTPMELLLVSYVTIELFFPASNRFSIGAIPGSRSPWNEKAEGT